MGSMITNSLNAIHNGLNQIEKSELGVLIGRAVSEFQRNLPSVHPVVKVSVVAFATIVAVAAIVINRQNAKRLKELTDVHVKTNYALSQANETIHEQKVDLNIAEVEAVDLNETIQEEKQNVANLNQQMINLVTRMTLNFKEKSSELDTANKDIEALNKQVKSLEVYQKFVTDQKNNKSFDGWLKKQKLISAQAK